MSTKNINSVLFSEIIKRLMLVLKVENEYEVAALLGFKKDAFSARKKRGAIPEDKIKLLCADRLINLDWIMTGKGEMTQGGRTPFQQSDEALSSINREDRLTDQELHFLIYQAVDEVAAELDKEQTIITTKDKAFLASELLRIFSKEDRRQYVTKETMIEQAVLLWVLNSEQSRIKTLLEKLGVNRSEKAYSSCMDMVQIREHVDYWSNKK